MSEWIEVGLRDVITQPIRDFGSFSLTNLINFVEGGVPFIKTDAIQNGYIDYKQLTFITEEVHKLLTKSIVYKGDLLFTKIGSVGRGAIYDGRFGECNSNAASAKIKIDSEKAIPEIILSILLCDETKRFFEGRIISTPPRLNLRDLYDLRFKISSDINEQRKISSFLSKIDSVISQTEAAIEKYQSIKQGLMQDLFTRGIDITTGKLRLTYTRAPELYKQTKLGFIPKEWEIASTKELLLIKGRIGWRGLKKNEFIEEGPYLITGMHFIDNKIDWNSCFHINNFRYEESPEIKVQLEDVLFTKDGSIGKVAYIDMLPGKASLNSHLLLLRPINDRIVSKYLYYELLGDRFNNYIEVRKSGSTLVGLSQTNFEKYNFPLPSSQEQKIIVERITSIDSKTVNEIHLLSKYKSVKTGLMQVLLTGKKRVKLDEKTN